MQGRLAATTMADTSAFNPAATERHFQELRALLDTTLKRLPRSPPEAGLPVRTACRSGDRHGSQPPNEQA